MAQASSSELNQLKGPLAALSEARFREAVNLLEERGQDPDVRAVMETVRYRLKRVRPPRRPSLQRLFYLPGEDLLVSEPMGSVEGLIQRQVMPLVWAAVERRLDPRLRDQLQQRIRQLRPGMVTQEYEIGVELWPAAARALEDLLRAAQLDKAIRRELVGTESSLITDVDHLLFVLKMAVPIEGLKQRLPPKPMEPLSLQALEEVRKFVLSQYQGRWQRTWLLLLVMARRSGNPGSLLEGMLTLNLGLDGAAKAEVLSRISALVLNQLDRQTQHVVPAGKAEVGTRAKNARDLVATLVSTERGLPQADPATRKQLAKLRSDAEAAVGSVVKDASTHANDAMMKGANAPIEVATLAEESIRALRYVETYAGAVGQDRAVNQALTSLLEEAKYRADEIRSKLERGALDGRDRESAVADFYFAVRIAELAGDTDQAVALLKRAQGVLMGH